MLRIIEDPAATLDEAFAFVREQLIGQFPPEMPAEAAALFMAWIEMSHRCGALWCASLVRHELQRPGDKRAPCLAVEKVIAQACPPKAPGGACN